MPFLENVTRGSGVPRERLLDVAHHYELFGGVSPINEQNRALIAALEPELRAHGIDLPIYFGNRNWQPFIADAMTRCATTASATRSRSSPRRIARTRAAGSTARTSSTRSRRSAPDAPAVSRLRMLYNHPGLRRGERRPRTRGARDPRVPAGFAHRVHRALDPHGDGAQLRVRGPASRDGAARRRSRRRRALAGRLPVPQRPAARAVARARRVRPSRDPGGRAGVVVSPIGFVSDHLEVLYDLDIEARETAERAGLAVRPRRDRGTSGVRRRDPRGDRRATRAGAPKRALGRFGPSWDTCAPDCCRPGNGGPRPGTPDSVPGRGT